ncbi:MAG: type II secretion system minor pseudopilin GspH [Coxiellaceae bacterium]|nr:type II secretion system minor pseudopilin GspH [Coxiellaceae bacterium]
MSRNVRKVDGKISDHSRTTGFTLIEVLIVLVIITIMTALAVMSFGHFGQTRREKMILEQFSATIVAVQQQAIFTPMAMSLAITNQGYRYYEYQLGTDGSAVWKPASGFALTHKTVFRHVFDVQVKNIATFESSSNSKAKPSILFLPSGYVTPFEVVFEGGSHRYLMSVKNNGEVTMVTREKK